MKKSIFVGLSVLMAASLSAAGGKGAADPVAPGFPAWVVPSGKAYIQGRPITPCDLRHKFTVIVEFDAAKALEHFMKAGTMARFMPTIAGGETADWAHAEMPRGSIVVFSNVGAKKDDVIKEAFKVKDKEKYQQIASINYNKVPMYDGVTFEGAPANGGKLPFVYVMGPTGTEPIYKGEPDFLAIRKAIEAAKKDMPEWKPYFGSVSEPKYVGKELTKALAKGKPLNAVAEKAKKGVKSGNEEQAKECQIIYDALEQTRSDLEYRISLEASAAPYRAAYDLEVLMRNWPNSKKRVAQWAGMLKANAEFGALGKAFVQCMKYNDPAFTCKNAGEAKKFVAELQKYKKTIEPMKESKVIVVQNAALIVDLELDSAIAALPTKVPVK